MLKIGLLTTCIVGLYLSCKAMHSGIYILKRYMDASIFWNGGYLHNLIKEFLGIKIPKYAKASAYTVLICSTMVMGITINPKPEPAKAEEETAIAKVKSGDDQDKVKLNTEVEVTDLKRISEEKKKQESEQKQTDTKQKAKEDAEQKETKEETTTTKAKEEEEKKPTEQKKEEEEKKTTEQKKEEEEKKQEPEKKPTIWENIPLCDTISPVKTYMDDVKITARNTEQWRMFNEAKFGEVITDDLGFQYIEGIDPETNKPMKFYTVALSTYYLDHIGQKFRITMTNGFVFGAITGDIKSDAHTHAGNQSDIVERKGKDSDRCLAGSEDMLEFIIDESIMLNAWPTFNKYASNGSLNKNYDEAHMFEGSIAKIEVLVNS